MHTLPKPVLAAIGLALLVSVGAAEEPSAPPDPRPEVRRAPDPEWYRDSFVHTHHSAGGYSPAWDEQFKAIRPDAVQFHASAHAIGRKLAGRYGFQLVCTVNASGEYGHLIRYYKTPADRSKFVPRRNADGSPTGRIRGGRLWRHLCFNSPAVDEFLIPRFSAATRKFQPSLILIHSTVITLSVLYCDNCRRMFR